MGLVTMPFSLAMRAASVATLVWFETVKAMIRIPVDLSWRAAVWTIALVTLPIRIFTALQREQTLEANLNEMQIQLERVACETEELEQRLQKAISDRRVIETVFEEIEEEHEKALSRIDLLENELQDLKEKNLRLNEVYGKGMFDYEAHDGKVGYVHEGIPLAGNYCVPSWGSGYKKSGVIREDVLMHGDSWDKVAKGKAQEQSLLKVVGPCPIPPQESLTDLIIDEVLECRRNVALARSLFSAILSLLVGMIMWEAEDPCMPLVAALFIVVGMSLRSVVQFFSTIQNKPASDAVALLSFNWFILGTLTSPSLPSITCMLAPRAIRIVYRIASFLGLSAYLNG